MIDNHPHTNKSQNKKFKVVLPKDIGVFLSPSGYMLISSNLSQWLLDNVSEQHDSWYCITENNNTLYFLFDNCEHATHFALVWGGDCSND